jgi:membrane carboxypeptidase/penicillin-binding protein PbpC
MPAPWKCSWQVGSADFANESIDGQVDGTRSARSPGSTPAFADALALDQDDSSAHHAKRCAAQFRCVRSGKFRSRICRPITDALARSRNIPAVTLIGTARPTLYGSLKRPA